MRAASWRKVGQSSADAEWRAISVKSRIQKYRWSFIAGMSEAFRIMDDRHVIVIQTRRKGEMGRVMREALKNRKCNNHGKR